MNNSVLLFTPLINEINFLISIDLVEISKSIRENLLLNIKLNEI